MRLVGPFRSSPHERATDLLDISRIQRAVTVLSDVLQSISKPPALSGNVV